MNEKQKILIIDSDAQFVERTKDILAPQHRIKTIMNEFSALSTIEDFGPDLILLSVSAAEFDGFEICKRLKKHEATSSIPVIFVSRRFQLDEKMNGFLLGGAAYLVKPVNPDEMKQRVKTHLELKNAHHSVQRYNQQLRDMLEAQTRELIKSERQSAFCLMIQGIIHNLRNPLVGILGHADFIKNNTEKLIRIAQKKQDRHGDEMVENLQELTKDADAILNAAQVLSDMIDTLLIKSRSDKNSELDDVDLNQIIQNELDFLRADLKFKNCITKKIELSAEKLMVKVVVSEISQVFQNIIRNAIHALWYQKKAVISIASGEDGTKVWFSVTDNGPGISKKIIDKIFDPFFTTKPKAMSKNSLKPFGTGLGLYSCMEILKTYQGDIKVNSIEGKGTTFTVFLPKAQQIEREAVAESVDHSGFQNS